MLERYFNLFFRHFKVCFCGFQTLYRTFFAGGKFLYEIFQTGEVATRALADVQLVLPRTRKRNAPLVGDKFYRVQRDFETAIFRYDRSRLVMKQRVHKCKPAVLLSILHAVRINRAVYVNLESVGVIMHLDKFDVFPYPFQIQFLPLYLFGKFLSYLILQSKQFLFVSAFQIAKPCHFHIKFHFSLDFRVGGSNRLDFRIR